MPVTPTRVHKIMPLRGRRTAWPADEMGDEYSPNCLNVRFRFGEVKGTPGRNVLAGPATNEAVKLFVQFPQLDGTIWVVMLTTTKVFRWGDGSPGVPRQWHQILPGGTVPTGTAQWTAAVGEGKLFFGRSDDELYFWTGVATDLFRTITSQITDTNGYGNGVTAPRAKFLEYFNNRLMVGYTVEGANTFANRIRWTESGSFNKWNETFGLGAGFLDLVEGGQEAIRGMRSFGSGGRMFVTTRTTIKDILATGSTPTHVELLRVRGIGGNAPYTVASSGEQVFFLGYDRNVYMWDGVQLHPIGTVIQDELYSLTNPSTMDAYFATVCTQRDEYWLILSGSDAFIYDYRRQAWTRDTIPGFTALGEVEDTTDAPAWNTITTTWLTERATWDSLVGGLITTLFGGRTDGSTSELDETIAFDYFSIGSILDRFVETPDFYIDETAGMGLLTVYRLLLNYALGNTNSFQAGVSFDRGTTWLEQTVTPVAAGFNLVEFMGPATGNTIRFRFRENDATGTFRWRSYSYEIIEAGDYIGTTTG